MAAPSTRSQALPRRAEDAAGSRVTASRAAPVPSNATAVNRSHPGCRRSSEIATDDTPAIPAPRPTSTCVRARCRRTRSTAIRQLATASKLPEPIFTPATKADIGDHDENIDFDRAVEIIASGREPLRALIGAMHSKLLLAELRRQRDGD